MDFGFYTPQFQGSNQSYGNPPQFQESTFSNKRYENYNNDGWNEDSEYYINQKQNSHHKTNIGLIILLVVLIIVLIVIILLTWVIKKKGAAKPLALIKKPDPAKIAQVQSAMPSIDWSKYIANSSTYYISCYTTSLDGIFTCYNDIDSKTYLVMNSPTTGTPPVSIPFQAVFLPTPILLTWDKTVYYPKITTTATATTVTATQIASTIDINKDIFSTFLVTGNFLVGFDSLNNNIYTSIITDGSYGDFIKKTTNTPLFSTYSVITTNNPPQTLTINPSIFGIPSASPVNVYVIADDSNIYTVNVNNGTSICYGGSLNNGKNSLSGAQSVVAYQNYDSNTKERVMLWCSVPILTTTGSGASATTTTTWIDSYYYLLNSSYLLYDTNNTSAKKLLFFIDGKTPDYFYPFSCGNVSSLGKNIQISFDNITSTSATQIISKKPISSPDLTNNIIDIKVSAIAGTTLYYNATEAIYGSRYLYVYTDAGDLWRLKFTIAATGKPTGYTGPLSAGDTVTLETFVKIATNVMSYVPLAPKS